MSDDKLKTIAANRDYARKHKADHYLACAMADDIDTLLTERKDLEQKLEALRGWTRVVEKAMTFIEKRKDCGIEIVAQALHEADHEVEHEDQAIESNRLAPILTREQRLEAALMEMDRLASKHSEIARIARNEGQNCVMDSADGKKFAFYMSAQLLRAALKEEEG